MSSHKEAPAIAKDPAADSTDVYAFVSPDSPETVTILANYVPLQDPDGGPNFAEFGAMTSVAGAAATGDDVQYDININNTGSGLPDIIYRFKFQTEILNPATFLYATGPITYSAGSGYSTTWNRRQTYTVTRIAGGVSTLLSPAFGTAGVLTCPPCNIGPRSTPNYASLSAPAVHTLPGGTGEIVFAGQRAEGFFVDLGAIFDLGDLRPLSPDQLIAGPSATGVNSLSGKNVHSIAMQIPITSLTSDGKPLPLTNASADPRSVIGVYTTASRQTVRMFDPATGVTTASGNYNQVSRLGSPLVNEVVVPMASKDYFNSQPPVNDSQFAGAVVHPELAGLLPVLYPGAFNNLKAYTKPRVDLVAIFATGIPGAAIASAFGVGTVQQQATPTISEMLRLNMGVAPTSTSGTDPGHSNMGLLGGDLAGFPNGRRPLDDVVTVSLKAVAGAVLHLFDSTFTPDATVAAIDTGVTASAASYQAAFPYLADPHDGFNNPPATPAIDTSHL